jgi:hypothetical protein
MRQARERLGFSDESRLGLEVSPSEQLALLAVALLLT